MVDFVRIVDPDKPGGSLVLAKNDFDPAKHQLFGDGSLAKPHPAVEFDATPGSIATVRVEKAMPVVAAADSAEELDALERDEKANPRTKGGRRAVLKGISERRQGMKR